MADHDDTGALRGGGAKKSPSQNKSSNPSSSFHFVVEDFHGRPASQPLSLSPTPQRSSLAHFGPQSVPADSFVSPVYDREMRFSGHFSSPDPDHDDFPAAIIGHEEHSSAAQCGGGGGQRGGQPRPTTSSTFVALTQQQSGTASHSRNGRTTVVSSMSGLHVTQSGVVIPPIQGIPQPKGLPAPSPVQYAKLKERPKAGKKRSRLAVKGAFSNMTSVAVLQQVQPLQKKTRQVEPAGWSPLDYLPEHEALAAAEPNVATASPTTTAAPSPLNNATADPVNVSASVVAAAGAFSRGAPRPPPPAANCAVTSNAPLAMAAAVPQVSQHSRSSSGASETSLTPSEAAMVAAAWEEDVAAAAAAAAEGADAGFSQAGQGTGCGGAGHSSPQQDDWDRAEEEAMRVREQMLRQQQQQRHYDELLQESAYDIPDVGLEVVDEYTSQSKSVSCAISDQPHRTPSAQSDAAAFARSHHSPEVVGRADTQDDAVPYAVRTAASADRSPTHQRSPEQQRVAFAAEEVYSAHQHDSLLDKATLGTAAAAPESDAAAERGGRRASSTTAGHPRGFEQFAERGQQRRAEAERAQMARAAEAAGQPFPVSDGATAANSSAAAETKRPRKMSVLPPPRGFEAFAVKGHARRAEAEREEALRGQEEAENCTHAPRINQRGSVSSTVPPASRKGSQLSPADQAHAAGASQASGDGGGDSVQASVFERLSREAERREERLRQLEQKAVPSFTPQRATVEAAKAGSDGQPSDAAAPPASAAAKLRGGAGPSVFESLYADAKRPSVSQVAVPTKGGDRVERGRSQHGNRRAPASRAAAATSVGGDGERDTGAATPPAEKSAEMAHGEGTTAANKKSAAEIARHLDEMRAREEERRAKWQQRLASRAADEKERAARLALNPKTGVLAERARARYRMREEMRQLETAAADGQRTSEEKRAAERVMRRQHQQQQPGSSETKAAVARREGGSESTKVAAAATTTPASRSLGAEFFEHQQKTEERRHRQLEVLRMQRAEEELRECTFRPRLNTASEKMAQRTMVESYARESDDEMDYATGVVAAANVRSQQDSASRALDLSCHRGHSPFVSARSRSLLQELHSDDEHFTPTVNPLNLQLLHHDGAAPPVSSEQRSPEPLSSQLRNLEEMLREWKELERECSPMLRQRQEASVGE